MLIHSQLNLDATLLWESWILFLKYTSQYPDFQLHWHQSSLTNVSVTQTASTISILLLFWCYGFQLSFQSVLCTVARTIIQWPHHSYFENNSLLCEVSPNDFPWNVSASLTDIFLNLLALFDSHISSRLGHSGLLSAAHPLSHLWLLHLHLSAALHRRVFCVLPSPISSPILSICTASTHTSKVPLTSRSELLTRCLYFHITVLFSISQLLLCPGHLIRLRYAKDWGSIYSEPEP